jgi:hypothetical protein
VADPSLTRFTRAELFAVLKNEKLVKLFEALLTTATTAADLTAVEAALTDHINDAGDAHQASAIGATPSGGLAGITVAAQLTELDTEKEATGTAAAAIALHLLAADPHTQYATDAALTAHTGDTGNPHATTAAQVGADPAGTAAAAIVAHVGLADPHTQYVLENAAIVGATKTKITYDAKGLVTAGADATTADIADSANKRYVTDAQQTVLTNTSGTNTGDQFTATTASRLIGRGSASGAGAAQEITIGSGLTMTGTTLSASGAGTGDVVGPASSVDSNVALFDGVTGKLLKDGGGIKRMLANVTLGSAGVSLASGAITACAFLEIHIYIEGYSGSDTASLQFNGAAGTAYRYRWLTCAAGATTFSAGLIGASTDRIKVAAANTTNSRRIVAFVSNDSSVTEKLVQFGEVSGTTSAGSQATITLGNGAWVSGAATQITSVSLVSTSNMLAGTKMTIFGWN